jgi:hypothetical protein
VCTVLLRFAPGTAWPVLLGAVRDEFVERPWDPPAAHWPDHPGFLGGRDRTAGGTWLAVDPDPRRPAVAALLNGRPLPPIEGVRPSRGGLPLHVLTHPEPPADLGRYDAFHLMRATPQRIDVWSWNGTEATHRILTPGDHVLVNDGVDADEDPLVPFVRPVLAHAATPDPRPGLPTAEAWTDWIGLLDGGDIDPTDPRALIVRHVHGDRVYGSTSVSLVGLGTAGVRYDFTANPGKQAVWHEIKS